MTFLRSLRALLWPLAQTGMPMNLSASSLAAQGGDVLSQVLGL